MLFKLFHLNTHLTDNFTKELLLDIGLNIEYLMGQLIWIGRPDLAHWP